eukprot:1827493-Pleurochrysis_carterae.AAC.1
MGTKRCEMGRGCGGRRATSVGCAALICESDGHLLKEAGGGRAAPVEARGGRARACRMRVAEWTFACACARVRGCAHTLADSC